MPQFRKQQLTRVPESIPDMQVRTNTLALLRLNTRLRTAWYECWAAPGSGSMRTHNAVCPLPRYPHVRRVSHSSNVVSTGLPPVWLRHLATDQYGR
ncbi:hypothetical protein HaLaN_14381 [Haematococcus lacustris]|uniref:Uncharacterized protein n=1 Tax=Haematococcus lacustris TaxID=44745 RepID=A0A699ZEV6_HAELA|nr:hypothetical protein HaLaN_14381 [Haematococcus lacustris]